MRIIMHVDLDAFFAACEERERPELKGLPVVIGHDPEKGKGRGVVSTANYKAREYGIHSGMPISKAYSLCPAAAFLPVNFPLYYRVAEGVMKILRKHADKFQQISIDEAFLDISPTGSFEKSRDIATSIKQEIENVEKVTCSIGIGQNKLISKIASDYEKPNGLTIVKPEETQNFLSALPVRKLYGIGEKTDKLLKKLGIETVGDIAKSDVQLLQSMFGRWGTELHFLAQGIDESEVEESEGIQSLGREHTFREDTSDVFLLHEIIDQISEDIHQSLEEEDMSCRTVVIKIRYENFETHTRQKTLSKNYSNSEAISNTAKELLKKFTESKKKIRLIGVRATNLHSETKQKSLGEFAR